MKNIQNKKIIKKMAIWPYFLALSTPCWNAFFILFNSHTEGNSKQLQNNKKQTMAFKSNKSGQINVL